MRTEGQKGHPSPLHKRWPDFVPYAPAAQIFSWCESVQWSYGELPQLSSSALNAKTEGLLTLTAALSYSKRGEAVFPLHTN